MSVASAEFQGLWKCSESVFNLNWRIENMNYVLQGLVGSDAQDLNDARWIDIIFN